jgi:hypothetical protein
MVNIFSVLRIFYPRISSENKSMNFCEKDKKKTLIPSLPMLGIRICLFLDLSDPDPLVRGTDPAPDPSIVKQK